MAYKRKTRDYFEIQGWYCKEWECVTTEETLRDAKKQLQCYRDNERNVSFRIKKCREAIV